MPLSVGPARYRQLEATQLSEDPLPAIGQQPSKMQQLIEVESREQVAAGCCGRMDKSVAKVYDVGHSRKRAPQLVQEAPECGQTGHPFLYIVMAMELVLDAKTHFVFEGHSRLLWLHSHRSVALVSIP